VYVLSCLFKKILRKGEKRMKVAIIGSGAGGLTVASHIRKFSKKAEITVVTLEKQVAYSQCAIPYVIGGEIESFEEIVMHTPEYYGERGIKIMTDSEVFEVVPSENYVRYRPKDAQTSIKNGFNEILSYDYLVIATGGSPFIPPVEGTNLNGVFKVRTMKTGKRLKVGQRNVKKQLL
jgi:NADH oxidase (H2O2-forming)